MTSPPPQALAARREIWSNRRPLYSKALKRLSPAGWCRLLTLCANADRAIKGEDKTDPWLLFEDIALGICGVPPLPQVTVRG